MKLPPEICVEKISIVNSLSSQSPEKAPPIALFPSWLFFVENLAAEASATPEQRREQVALHLESFAPVPAEQLLSGFISKPRSDSVLCYAAARERCRERLEKLPAQTLHCLPAFALWDNADVAAPRWEWLATESELTAILIEPDNALPVRILSWERGGSSLDSDEARNALIAECAERKKEIRSTAAHKDGIYLFDEQIVDPKKRCGEIRLKRLNADGSLVAAARVLRFTFADDSLWDADIRDAATLSRERKERKHAALCKQALSVCGILAVVLAVLQIALWIFGYKTQQLLDKEAAQRPQVADIRAQAKLIADISKVQENKLQTIRTVAVLNAQRPNGVAFSNFSGNGTSGTISVTGTAENITLAKEFEKNLHACGLFKEIVFTANIASVGANFSLQCQPDKNAIGEIDFYNTPEKEDSSADSEAAAEAEGEATPAEAAPEASEEAPNSEPASEGDNQ